jgi:hypothetical protein
MLLERGAAINTPCEDGRAALHVASINDHVEVVQLLLENGADLYARDDDGLTPFDIASSYGWEETVQLLSEYRAKSVKWFRLVDFTIQLQRPTLPLMNDDMYMYLLYFNTLGMVFREGVELDCMFALRYVTRRGNEGIEIWTTQIQVANTRASILLPTDPTRFEHKVRRRDASNPRTVLSFAFW